MFKKLLFLAIFFSAILQLFFVNLSLAQEPYKVLAPLPGTTLTENCTPPNCETTIQKYLPGIFNFLIGLSAVFAVVMIVVGGFQYMTTDALQGKEDGKARIWNAVKGLILVIGASLILNEINPNLLKINLNLDPVVVTPTNMGGGGSLGGGGGTNVGNCTNCSPLSNSGLSLSPNLRNHCNQTQSGCFLSTDLTSKLKNLNGSTNGLTITEAWPASRSHRDECHRNGTCVDAVISNMNNVDVVKDFIEKARQSGLRAVFETFDQNFRQQLLNAGVPLTNILVMRQCANNSDTNCITNTHFSVYNN